MRVIYLTILTCLLSLNLLGQVPNWAVDPNSYENTMTITGVLEMEDGISQSEDDLIAAFVEGSCRGTAKPIYNAAADKYYVYMMVLSNQAFNERVTFKMWDQSEAKIIDCTNLDWFELDRVTGTQEFPYYFTFKPWNAEVIDFGLKGIPTSAKIDSTTRTIRLTVEEGTNINDAVAEFELSDEATAKVDGKKQNSGVTSNNFSQGLVYTVTSSDKQTEKDWAVIIEYVSGMSSVKARDLKVFPNPTTGMIHLDLDRPSEVEVYDMLGQRIMRQEVTTYLDLSEFEQGWYTVCVRTNDAVYRTRVLKQ